MSVGSAQVRGAALAAVKVGTGIIFTTLLLIPILSTVNRIFEGTWYLNWRLMISVSAVLAFLIFAFVFVTKLLEMTSEDARERHSRLVFPAMVWLRSIYFGSIVLGLVIMVGTFLEGDVWWIVVLPAAFVFLGFFAWPRAIKLTECQIQQRRTLFGAKQIRFSDIESVISDPARNEIVVFGKNGQVIVHTAMHAGGVRFLQQLKSLAGKNAYSVGNLE